MKGRARLGLAVNVDAGLKKESARAERVGKAFSSEPSNQILTLSSGAG